MATRASTSTQKPTGWADGELLRRWSLAREPVEELPDKPKLKYLLGEATYLAEPAFRPFRRMTIGQSANPKVVMVLPGFATHPSRMRYLARQLERAGHKTKRWGLGFNLGPTTSNVDFLEARLEEIHDRYEQDVVLLGWSLGGLFARELAHRRPELVSKVITMGSPFSGDRRANNAWRIYQFVTGHRVDEPPIQSDVSQKPPVETVALWSARDGIVSARSACGRTGERDRAIALRCRHMGFSYAPEVIRTVLSELETTQSS
ncbi:hypothetical protein BPTFM16_01486 [Altererythrobacter insulae]|nr:hypothetical protein BPTFM16_01486 [Altererythrobacter insulae]